ncbi:MAG: hypothetical protein LBI34_00725 [Puniceicoccales bacterium]|jgi:hypothetical protein|nr:hypothetical protein [Puniceicoccales bacterium]
MESLKLPDGVSLFSAVRYGPELEKLLNKVSSSGNSETTKTRSIDIRPVTFQYLRTQANTVTAIIVWLGGHIARIVTFSVPLNDAAARKFAFSHLSFLVDYNKTITVDEASAKLTHLLGTAGKLDTTIAALTTEINNAIGAHNEGKQPTDCLSKSTDEGFDSLAVAKKLKHLQKKLEQLAEAKKNRHAIQIVINDVNASCPETVAKIQNPQTLKSASTDSTSDVLAANLKNLHDETVLLLNGQETPDLSGIKFDQIAVAGKKFKKVLANTQKCWNTFLNKSGIDKAGNYTRAGEGHKAGDKADQKLIEINRNFHSMMEVIKQQLHIEKLHGQKLLTDADFKKLDARLEALKTQHSAPTS